MGDWECHLVGRTSGSDAGSIPTATTRMAGETKDHYRPFRHPFVNGTRVQGGVGDTARTVSEPNPFTCDIKSRLACRW